MNKQPLQVVEQTEAQGGAVVVQAANPLDLPTEHFKAGLDRRKENRANLMEWVRGALVDGVDYGRIHVVGKNRCRLGRNCTDPDHFSKPSLFKPGAEKICGMLGVTVSYPSLVKYEQAALSGNKIENIIIRCELLDASGHVVADGVGARSLAQDYGDMNKALKMSEKSAHIDATLRMAGLSEVFTQDVEDMGLGAVAATSSKPTAGNQPSPKAGTSDRNAPPVRQNGASVSVVSDSDHRRLEAQIKKLGLDRERVKSWVVRATHGNVTHFNELSKPLYKKLYGQLEGWAERDAIQQEGTAA